MGDSSIVKNFYSSASSLCGSYKILNSSGGPIPARCLASLSIPRHVVSAYKRRTSSTARPLLPHCFLAATSSADPSSNELHVLGYEEDTFEVECSARVLHPPEIQALAISSASSSSSSSFSSTSGHTKRKTEEKNKEEGGEEKRKEREKERDSMHDDVLRMPLWFFTAYPDTAHHNFNRSLCSLWRCDVPVPGSLREGEEEEEGNDDEEEEKKKNTELLLSSSASPCSSIERIQPELVLSLRSMKAKDQQRAGGGEGQTSFNRVRQLVLRECCSSSFGGEEEEGRAAGEGGEEKEEEEEEVTKQGERKSRRKKREEGKEESLLVVMNKSIQLFSVTSDGTYQGLLEIPASRGGSLQAAAFDPHHQDVVFIAESFSDRDYTAQSDGEGGGGGELCDSFIYSNGGRVRIVDIRTPCSLSSSSSSSSSSRSFTTFYQRRHPSLKSFSFSSSSSPSPCMNSFSGFRGDETNGDPYLNYCRSSSPFSFCPVPLSIDCNENLPFSLVTGSSDGSVMYWDSRLLAKPLMVLQDLHSHWVTRVKLNTFHDQLLLTASTDNTAKLHHVEPSTASNAALASSSSSSRFLSSSASATTPGVGLYTRHIVLEIPQEEDEEGEEEHENEKRDSEGLASEPIASCESSSFLPHNADAGAGGRASVSPYMQRKEEEKKEEEKEERKMSGREKNRKNRKRKENYTISSYEGSEDVIVDLAWAGDDAWIYASLSADGHIAFHHVPSKEKYSILL